jgi:hypothetical protein
MSNSRHGNDASLVGFMAGWDRRLQENEQLPVGFAVLVLTKFGETPVRSTRLAEVLARPVSEAEAWARGHCTAGAPVEGGFIRAEDGLITYINPDRAKSAPRRRLQVGDRRFGMTGCGFDVFLYAPLVRPSLQVEETCTVTGTTIRLVFTPSRVESVDPAGAVAPIPPPQTFDRLEGMTVQECDAVMCSSRRPCLPRLGGVGPELSSSVAGPDVDPAGPLVPPAYRAAPLIRSTVQLVDDAAGGQRGSRAIISADLEEFLRAHWGVRPASATPDLGGSCNLNLLVTDGRSLRVARVYRPFVTRQQVAALQAGLVVHRGLGGPPGHPGHSPPPPRRHRTRTHLGTAAHQPHHPSSECAHQPPLKKGSPAPPAPIPMGQFNT